MRPSAAPRRRIARLACWLVIGCAASLYAPLSAQQRLNPDSLPPVGFGTLGQDDIGIVLRTSAFGIGVYPLDERVIRLLKPDTYASLRRLVDSKAADIQSVALRQGLTDPLVLLVRYFATEPQARFDPEALTVTSLNRFFRPAAILPITSRPFSDRQLRQRETANAIYLYSSDVRLFEDLTISYEIITSRDWSIILRKLDRERAAVEARAAGRRP